MWVIFAISSTATPIFEFSEASYTVLESIDPAVAVLRLAANSGVLSSNVFVVIGALTNGTAKSKIIGQFNTILARSDATLKITAFKWLFQGVTVFLLYLSWLARNNKQFYQLK